MAVDLRARVGEATPVDGGALAISSGRPDNISPPRRLDLQLSCFSSADIDFATYRASITSIFLLSSIALIYLPPGKGIQKLQVAAIGKEKHHRRSREINYTTNLPLLSKLSPIMQVPLFRLQCGVNSYEWGKMGKESAAAKFAAATPAKDFSIQADKPYAEVRSPFLLSSVW